MDRPQTIDVIAFIDSHKIGGLLIRTVALCFAIVLIDGFDTQSIGYVAPALHFAAPVSTAALGTVFSAGLVGLLLGAILFGFIADRFGRKLSLILCVTVFGIFSLATAHASSIDELALLRLIGGLGMGGAIPNGVALVAECPPQRRRKTAATVMIAGFSIGAAAGGFVAAWLLHFLSWRAVFIVGGIVPFLLLPFLIVWLPESAVLLARQNRSPERIAKLLGAFGGAVPHPVDFTAAEGAVEGNSVVALFGEGRALRTPMLWITFFMISVCLFFISNWLPTLIHNIGIPLGEAAAATGLFHLGGTFGAVVLGRTSDSFRPASVLVAVMLGAGFWLAVLGMVGAHVALIMPVLFATGFCVVGGQILTVAFAGDMYPTEIRSTGVGWGMSAGRLGGIFGPMAGAFLVSLHWPLASIFLSAAVPAVCGAGAIHLAGRDPRQVNAATALSPVEPG